MSNYRFLKRAGVELVTETDSALTIKIDGQDYVIMSQAGSRGKRTQRMVQRLLQPVAARQQAVYDQAMLKMPESERTRVYELSKLIVEGNNSDQADEWDAEIARLLDPHMDLQQLLESRLSAYERLDPDQEEELDHALLLGVQSVQHGSLEQEQNRKKAFQRGTLHHLDILRDVVIEFNDFLGRSGSRASA